jgi:hypothetical protein
MTLPKISMTCFLAQLHKCSQTEPDSFAMEFMMKLAEDQPEMMPCLVAMVKPLMNFGSSEEVSAKAASEMTLLTVFCVLGVVMESISATIDAKEMDEAWS